MSAAGGCLPWEAIYYAGAKCKEGFPERSRVNPYHCFLFADGEQDNTLKSAIIDSIVDRVLWRCEALSMRLRPGILSLDTPNNAVLSSIGLESNLTVRIGNILSKLTRCHEDN